MFIAPDHPHCDSCAMPNSGQEVCVIHLDTAQETQAALEAGETFELDGVSRVCRECLPTAWRPGDGVAPLQRKFDAITVPTDAAGVRRWNVLDQMLAEAYWDGWSARSEVGFVAPA